MGRVVEQQGQPVAQIVIQSLHSSFEPVHFGRFILGCLRAVHFLIAQPALPLT